MNAESGARTSFPAASIPSAGAVALRDPIGLRAGDPAGVIFALARPTVRGGRPIGTRRTTGLPLHQGAFLEEDAVGHGRAGPECRQRNKNEAEMHLDDDDDDATDGERAWWTLDERARDGKNTRWTCYDVFFPKRD